MNLEFKKPLLKTGYAAGSNLIDKKPLTYGFVPNAVGFTFADNVPFYQQLFTKLRAPEPESIQNMGIDFLADLLAVTGSHMIIDGDKNFMNTLKRKLMPVGVATVGDKYLSGKIEAALNF